MTTSLALYSPSGLLTKAAPLRRAQRRLEALGFAVEIDVGALAKHQRFAGDDAVRLDAIHRVAARAPGIAMATRGGYGLSRLLDAIDWKRIAAQRRARDALGRPQRPDGAAARAAGAHAVPRSWAGPMACYDFGREAGEHGEKTRRGGRRGDAATASSRR